MVTFLPAQHDSPIIESPGLVLLDHSACAYGKTTFCACGSN